MSKKVVGYLGRWACYRGEGGTYDIEHIDPHLFTHLIYAFAGLADDCIIKSLDPWADLPDDYGKDGYRKFNDLKKVNTKLKTLIAIGGWNEGSEKYSRLLAVPSNRTKFVQHVVGFLKTHGFDGLDLDWEYPNQRGGVAADVQNYIEWIKELRAEFDKHGFLLTAAVPATEASFTQSYDVPSLCKYMDFINVMIYDFHGSWETETGLNAPLYPLKDDIGTPAANLCLDASVKAWLKHGAPKEKLVVGVALYGRSFTLKDKDCVKPKCPATGPGSVGPLTGEAGMLGYHEICAMEKNSNALCFFHEESMVPYLALGNQWVGYDNVKSIQLKVDYIKANDLGGAMAWSIDTDDFNGKFGSKNPLLTVLKNGLLG